MANPAPGAAHAPTPHDGADPRAPYALKSGPSGALVLTLAPDVPFDPLRAAIRAGFGATPERYQGAQLRLDLGARDLDLYDLRRLIHVLKGEFGVDVIGLHVGSEALRRFAERELKLKVTVGAPPMEELSPAPTQLPPVADIADTPTELVSQPVPEDEEPEVGGRVLTIDGTVRSGAVVRFGGDVQVFGDVNPGAQVIAGGHVLIFGALKGLAHAGYRGDDKAVILAFDMRPTQLRIGKVIQVASSVDDRAHPLPEVAWLTGGAICVEPYKGRLPTASKESS